MRDNQQRETSTNSRSAATWAGSVMSHLRSPGPERVKDRAHTSQPWARSWRTTARPSRPEPPLTTAERSIQPIKDELYFLDNAACTNACVAALCSPVPSCRPNHDQQGSQTRGAQDPDPRSTRPGGRQRHWAALAQPHPHFLQNQG